LRGRPGFVSAGGLSLDAIAVRALFEPVTVAVQLEDVDVVSETIE
jgi:hypothetical protein